MPPYISIVIPTFNSGKTLRKCLDSIYSQTYKDFEVIIIDSLSDDNTIEIIKEYRDISPSIKHLSEKDSGIYDAMNKGIKIATGKWFYFLGSDDYLFGNNTLEAVAKYLKKTTCLILYGNVKMLNNGYIYDGEFNLEKLLHKNICHQAIFYNGILFKNICYNLEYKYLADYDLNLKLFSIFKFNYINICIAFYNNLGISSLQKDIKFQKAKESLIITYFKNKLHTSIFKIFRGSILKKGLNHIKNVELSEGMRLLLISTFHYLRFILKTNSDQK